MRRSRRRASLPPALPKADAADEPGEKESKEELPADGPPPARSRAARRPSLSSFAKAGGNVRVFCRLRPQNERELAAGGKIATVVADDGTSLDLLQGLAYGMEAESRLRFSFDRIFAPGAPQLEVFETVAAPVVAEVLRGINGTVFAYGQTSSGKTYTMEGPSLEDAELMGIVPRCVGALFDGIADAPATTEFTLSVSMLEIYMERIRDLLDSSRVALKVREDPSEGVVVVGLSQQGVTSPEEIFALLRTGADNRAKGATRMNKNSSRSHSIVVLHINQLDTASGSTTKGRLYLVDLAGSEKVSKTGAAGQTLAEAKTINKSLSTLGQVITALTSSRASHIPYRDSKLTRVLQESLGGNSRTALVINCSCSSDNEAETLSTLRFGTRAKNIRNKPRVNKKHSRSELLALLKSSEAEIARLRARLAAAGGRSPEERVSLGPTAVLPSLDDDSGYRELQQQLQLEVEARRAAEAALDEAEERVDPQVERLTADCDALREELTVVRSALASEQEAHSGLQMEYSMLQAECTMLRDELLQLRAASAAAPAAAADAASLASAAGSGTHTEEGAAAAAAATAAAAEAAAAAAVADAEAAAAAAAKAAAEREALLHSKLAAAQAASAEAQHQLAQLRVQAAQASEAAEDRVSELARVQEQLAQLRSALSKAEGQRDTLVGKTVALEEQMAASREAADEAAAVASAAAASAAAQLGQLREQLASALDSSEQQAARAKEAELAASSASDDVRRLQATVDRQAALLQQVQADLDDCRRRAAAAEEEAASGEEQLAASRARLAALAVTAEQVGDLKAQLAQLREQLSAAQDAERRSAESLADSRQAEKEIGSALTAAREALAASEARCGSLTSQLAAALEAAAAAKATASAVAADLSGKEAALAGLAGEKAELSKRIAEAEGSASETHAELSRRLAEAVADGRSARAMLERTLEGTHSMAEQLERLTEELREEREAVSAAEAQASKVGEKLRISQTAADSAIRRAEAAEAHAEAVRAEADEAEAAAHSAAVAASSRARALRAELAAAAEAADELRADCRAKSAALAAAAVEQRGLAERLRQALQAVEAGERRQLESDEQLQQLRSELENELQMARAAASDAQAALMEALAACEAAEARVEESERQARLDAVALSEREQALTRAVEDKCKLSMALADAQELHERLRRLLQNESRLKQREELFRLLSRELLPSGSPSRRSPGSPPLSPRSPRVARSPLSPTARSPSAFISSHLLPTPAEESAAMAAEEALSCFAELRAARALLDAQARSSGPHAALSPPPARRAYWLPPSEKEEHSDAELAAAAASAAARRPSPMSAHSPGPLGRLEMLELDSGALPAPLAPLSKHDTALQLMTALAAVDEERLQLRAAVASWQQDLAAMFARTTDALARLLKQRPPPELVEELKSTVRSLEAALDAKEGKDRRRGTSSAVDALFKDVVAASEAGSGSGGDGDGDTAAAAAKPRKSKSKKTKSSSSASRRASSSSSSTASSGSSSGGRARRRRLRRSTLAEVDEHPLALLSATAVHSASTGGSGSSRSHRSGSGSGSASSGFSELSQLRTSYDALWDSHAALVSQMEGMSTKVEAAQAEAAAARRELAERKQRVEAGGAASALSGGEAALLQSQLAAVKAQLKEAKQRVNDLSMELLLTERGRSREVRRLDAVQAENERLRQRVAALPTGVSKPASIRGGGRRPSAGGR
eukprot:PLAT12506.9.p1 GENE.PLAT12506.9~~PLAT12506.9.p1  ORF type:complete len:1706 (-),score=833.76 PLAT12506.9:54-5171(-)